MEIFRIRSTLIWALGLALASTVLLPLSHLGADHSEDCPLCNPSSHSFTPTAAALSLDAGPSSAEDFLWPSDASVVESDYRLLPPGRAPPLLHLA